MPIESSENGPHCDPPKLEKVALGSKVIFQMIAQMAVKSNLDFVEKGDRTFSLQAAMTSWTNW